MFKIKKAFGNIKGILADIDGTLYFKGQAIKGAIETVSSLREMGIKLLFFTNTDSKTPKTILHRLHEYGYDIYLHEVFTPIIALKEFLSSSPGKKCYLVSTEEIRAELEEFLIQPPEEPDFVIISDFQDNWDVNRLNEAFRYLIKGAKLLGTQGNRYFLDRNGEPVIDTGSFVHLLAQTAQVEAKIFGKPSKDYFLNALKIINLSPDEVIVVGDDLETDIQGANNMKIKSVLVKTGKGQFVGLGDSKITPYMEIESFTSILKLFQK